MMIEPWMIYVAVIGVSSLGYAVYVIHQKHPSFFAEVFKLEVIKVKIPDRCRVKKGENPFFKVIPLWEKLQKIPLPEPLKKHVKDFMKMVA